MENIIITLAYILAIIFGGAIIITALSSIWNFSISEFRKTKNHTVWNKVK